VDPVSNMCLPARLKTLWLLLITMSWLTETRSFVEVGGMVRVFPLKLINLHVAYTLLLEMLAGENRDALDHKKLLADMKISIPHLEVPTCSKQRHVLTCS
jgi:hypothetical protein